MSYTTHYGVRIPNYRKIGSGNGRLGPFIIFSLHTKLQVVRLEELFLDLIEVAMTIVLIKWKSGDDASEEEAKNPKRMIREYFDKKWHLWS